jgi:hypothetical protein
MDRRKQLARTAPFAGGSDNSAHGLDIAARGVSGVLRTGHNGKSRGE